MERNHPWCIFAVEQQDADIRLDVDALGPALEAAGVLSQAVRPHHSFARLLGPISTLTAADKSRYRIHAAYSVVFGRGRGRGRRTAGTGRGGAASPHPLEPGPAGEGARSPFDGPRRRVR